MTLVCTDCGCILSCSRCRELERENEMLRMQLDTLEANALEAIRRLTLQRDEAFERSRPCSMSGRSEP